MLVVAGYPDVASRALLRSIVASRSNILPVIVLTDPDPHGLHIALTYAAALPVHSFVWLGVKPSYAGAILSGLPYNLAMPLTDRERVLCQNSLKAESKKSQPGAIKGFCAADIYDELRQLLNSGIKFEIEALAALTLRKDAVLSYIDQQLELLKAMNVI